MVGARIIVNVPTRFTSFLLLALQALFVILSVNQHVFAQTESSMGVVNQLPPDFGDVDVIIVGGGTAGCVVASRVSDAYPNLSVLVIEGGKNNFENPSIIYPLLFLGNIAPTSENTLFYQGIQEPELNNRQLVVPSGGVLGGGSSINLLTYSRAQRQDFDSWRTRGWSANELIPYMKKLESYFGPGSSETHGANGPVEVTKSTFNVPVSEDGFIDAAAEVGYSEDVDIQDLDTNNATQRNLRYVSREGRRQDAAHTYLHPRLQDGRHPKLRVLVEHQVVRVLIKDRKAVGVEYRPNPKFQSGNTAVKTIKAKKMVVVSAGALGTPLVLERSGVGDPTILGRAGVKVLAPLPGVGRNYIDHHLLTHPYWSSLLPNETVDEVYAGRIDVGQLIASNDPKLGWTAQDITSKVRPSNEEAAALGPAFLRAWNRDFRDVPNRPISIITSLNGFPGDPTGLPPAQFFSSSTFTVYPYSRGHIHITAGNLDAPIDFQTGFLSDSEDLDVKKSMWAYKKQREIIRRMEIYRGEYAPGHPPFPAGSDAECRQYDAPLANVRDINYTAQDDAILEQWVRQTVGTTWHSMGTCKMAPLSEFGVVDGTLSVHGVRGLKIADLSIPPLNVAANTANTAYIIGEKAADLFINELGRSRDDDDDDDDDGGDE